MSGKGKWRVWMGLVWSGVAACGQELVLPDQPPSPAIDAPTEGFTGAGGGGDEATLRPRLPILEQPIFTTYGGAGGDPTGAGGDPTGAGGVGETSSQGATSGQGVNGNLAAGGMGTGGTAATAGTGAAGARASAGADAGPPSLLFSEYVEGSGSFKALEIYALGASSLEGCELLTYSNGKVEPSRLALHGQLGAGAVQVLCSAALATAQPTVCDRSTNLIFNGDDALALSCGGALLDVIGQIGVDPGEAWGVGATVDHTLRRRCEVLAGHGDGSAPFEIDPEWLTLGTDTFSDLGARNCAP